MRSMKKEEIDKKLGNVFKEYRVKNHLTQEKIAEKLEISVKYISRIENGSGGVKVETLVNYMNILGISPNVIFEELVINKDVKPQLELSKKISKLSEEELTLVNGIVDLICNL